MSSRFSYNTEGESPEEDPEKQECGKLGDFSVKQPFSAGAD